MSLAKIPCILLLTFSLHVVFTPPGVPSKEERIPTISVWERVLELYKVRLVATKVIIWTIGLAEITLLLAQEFPSSTMSPLILSFFSSFPNANVPDLNLRLTPMSMLGFCVTICGCAIRYECYRTLGHLFTFGHSIRTDHRLVTNRLYSVVRHPGYTGILLVNIGMFFWYTAHGGLVREMGLQSMSGRLLFGGLGIMQVVVVTSLLKRMKGEDVVLKKQFGKEWSDWARRVRYYIIPGVY